MSIAGLAGCASSLSDVLLAHIEGRHCWNRITSVLLLLLGVWPFPGDTLDPPLSFRRSLLWETTGIEAMRRCSAWRTKLNENLLDTLSSWTPDTRVPHLNGTPFALRSWAGFDNSMAITVGKPRSVSGHRVLVVNLSVERT